MFLMGKIGFDGVMINLYALGNAKVVRIGIFPVKEANKTSANDDTYSFALAA